MGNVVILTMSNSLLLHVSNLYKASYHDTQRFAERSWLCMQELGINAIELMPSHEFNELEYYAYNPVMGDYK
jgi:1,4-alpha-glucan branching enzyme